MQQGICDVRTTLHQVGENDVTFAQRKFRSPTEIYFRGDLQGQLEVSTWIREGARDHLLLPDQFQGIESGLGRQETEPDTGAARSQPAHRFRARIGEADTV